MKSLIKIAALSFFIISGFANSKDDNTNVVSPIIFEIISKDSVTVNGVKTTLKGSWQEAMKHINPDINNYYKITNKSNLLEPASSINEYMDIVAKVSGVKVELVK